MHDLGPIIITAPNAPSGLPADAIENAAAGDADLVSVSVLCDDAEQLVHAMRSLGSSNTELFVETEHSLAAGDDVMLVFSFPGLLRPVHLASTVKSTTDESEPARGVHVVPKQFDREVEKRLAEVVEKIESRNPDLVARSVRVLVVEDNPHCAKLIQEGLHLAGKRAFGNRVVFDVPMAANAADAFTFLHSRPIDVLITDIYLGGVSGTTVIEHVRRDSGLRSIPVIAISAGDEATKQVAMEAGADVFLPKPVRLRQIVGTVGKVLELDQVAWR